MKLVYIFFVLLTLISCNNTNKIYYKNGNIKKIEKYKNGKLNGIIKHYHPNGNIKAVIKYKGGVKNGIYKLYYSNEKIFQKAEYKNDELTGELISYYRNGNIEIKQNYDKGMKNGKHFEYYKNGNLKLFGLWKYDSIIYYEKYDTNGEFIEDYRKISIIEECDTIQLGKTYKAKLKIQGPLPNRITEDSIYYGSITPRLVKKDSVERTKSYKAYTLNKINDTAVLIYKPQEVGKYFYFGKVKISLDSISFPRFYDFRESFYVYSPAPASVPQDTCGNNSEGKPEQ